MTEKGVSACPAEVRERAERLVLEDRDGHATIPRRPVQGGRWHPAHGVGLVLRGGARPRVQATIGLIDAHGEVHGVERSCRVLPIAPSTDHEHAGLAVIPSGCRAPEAHDAALRREIRRVVEGNFGVHRMRKAWRQMLSGRDPGRALHERRSGGRPLCHS